MPHYIIYKRVPYIHVRTAEPYHALASIAVRDRHATGILSSRWNDPIINCRFVTTCHDYFIKGWRRASITLFIKVCPQATHTRAYGGAIRMYWLLSLCAIGMPPPDPRKSGSRVSKFEPTVTRLHRPGQVSFLLGRSLGSDKVLVPCHWTMRMHRRPGPHTPMACRPCRNLGDSDKIGGVMDPDWQLAS